MQVGRGREKKRGENQVSRSRSRRKKKRLKFYFHFRSLSKNILKKRDSFPKDAGLDEACFQVPYDILVMSVGCTNNTFGVKGVEVRCMLFCFFRFLLYSSSISLLLHPLTLSLSLSLLLPPPPLSSS